MPSKEFLLEHDEISIREAFERLLNGLEVTNAYGRVYKMDDKNDLSVLVKTRRNLDSPHTWEGSFTLLDIVNHKFYVKKPFNVRKALIENPDEYVAKIKLAQDIHSTMSTYYLFFDSKEMSIFYSPSPTKQTTCTRLHNLDLLEGAVPYGKEME